jgi:hypothetical protein
MKSAVRRRQAELLPFLAYSYILKMERYFPAECQYTPTGLHGVTTQNNMSSHLCESLKTKNKVRITVYVNLFHDIQGYSWSKISVVIGIYRNRISPCRTTILLTLPVCKSCREIYCSSVSSRPGVIRHRDQTRIHSYHVFNLAHLTREELYSTPKFSLK